jgi:hypothetical protein
MEDGKAPRHEQPDKPSADALRAFEKTITTMSTTARTMAGIEDFKLL